jgi:hypothetical protein
MTVQEKLAAIINKYDFYFGEGNPETDSIADEDTSFLISHVCKLETALVEANELCRSAHSIAQREGTQINWDAFRKNLKLSLEKQHKLIYGVIDEARMGK